MGNELVKAIKTNTEKLFENAAIMLETCNLDYMLCGLPVWKHVYHMFHSCDQWFINPHEYEEPYFHVPGLNSLNEQSEKALSREDLSRYLEDVRRKIMGYLDSLTDQMLCEIPAGGEAREGSRLSLIISQHRHFYAHLGNINATTIIETGKWPRVIGTSGGSTEGLYE